MRMYRASDQTSFIIDHKGDPQVQLVHVIGSDSDMRTTYRVFVTVYELTKVAMSSDPFPVFKTGSGMFTVNRDAIRQFLAYFFAPEDEDLL